MLIRKLKKVALAGTESLHIKVWRKISKDKFAGLYSTNFVTQATVLEHSFVFKDFFPLLNRFSQLTSSPSCPSKEGLEYEKEDFRVSDPEKKNSKKVKKG